MLAAAGAQCDGAERRVRRGGPSVRRVMCFTFVPRESPTKSSLKKEFEFRAGPLPTQKINVTTKIVAAHSGIVKHRDSPALKLGESPTKSSPYKKFKFREAP